MRRKLGVLLIAIGILMVIAGSFLLFHNRAEADQSAAFAEKVLPPLTEKIVIAKETAEYVPLPVPDPVREMTVTEIDGYYYVGILSIPSIEYTQPIMSDWSYTLLNVSACRFSGSVFQDNLVICAHNYDGLHRKLASLSVGAEVVFTDMDGAVWRYTVAGIETLNPDQIEEMTESEYPLTFFTCTYGGQTRLTLRCSAAGINKT